MTRSDGERPPSELHAMQQLLRALVTAPAGVRPALEGRPGVPGWLDAWSDPAARLRATVRGDAQLSAEARLDVYAEAYFARLREVLEGDHPAVVAVCGDAAFSDLVTAFLVAHPSRSPTLRDLAGPFPEFLASHPVAGFARDRWAGLAEVARLEAAFSAVFDAPETPALTVEALSALAPERWAELPLRPVASFALVRCDGSSAEIVRAVRRGEAIPAWRPEPETVAVWREHERAVFRRIDAAEAEALGAALEGARFGDLCVRLVDAGCSEGEAAERAAAWLAGWVGAGWLAALPEGLARSASADPATREASA